MITATSGKHKSATCDSRWRTSKLTFVLGHGLNSSLNRESNHSLSYRSSRRQQMRRTRETRRLTNSSNNLRHRELGLRVLSGSESDHETESKDVENESDANERLEVSSVSFEA